MREIHTCANVFKILDSYANGMSQPGSLARAFLREQNHFLFTVIIHAHVLVPLFISTPFGPGGNFVLIIYTVTVGKMCCHDQHTPGRVAVCVQCTAIYCSVFCQIPQLT